MRGNHILKILAYTFTKQGYFIGLLVGILAGVYAYYLNLVIPKPETFWELCKYLFGFTGKYLGTIVVNLFAFISVFITGAATMINGIKEIRGYDFFGEIDKYNPYETTLVFKILFSIVALIGLALIILAFMWYFYYSMMLIGVLLILAVIGLVIAWVISSK